MEIVSTILLHKLFFCTSFFKQAHPLYLHQNVWQLQEHRDLQVILQDDYAWKITYNSLQTDKYLLRGHLNTAHIR